MRTAGLILALVVLLFASTSMGVATAQQAQTSWVAYLSSTESVPRNNSQATGTASFQLATGGTGVQYWVMINGIQNMLMGHIHIGAAGQNGAVAVWLYPAAPPPALISGAYSGMIGTGTIAPANFAGGPLAGQPLSALINAMNSGNAYVQFHTSAFPGGEIRGQIR